MRRWNKTLIACVCCAAAFSITALSSVFANTPTVPLAPVLVYGQAVKEGENSLHVTNSNPNVLHNDMIVTSSMETTRILDATTGLPVAFEDIRDGETVYAYIGPVMTLSLPPMSNASMILCRIPADYKVPEYLEVTSLEKNGQTAALTASNGSKYKISADTQILPYLTRNIVTRDDLTPGKTCLVWSQSGSDTASKIVIFPEDANSSQTENTEKTGWIQENESWFYYRADGTLQSGWLNDEGYWYYLNPETHKMQTGFLTIDGKTYFLLEDGKMLTKAKMFTPGEDGALELK